MLTTLVTEELRVKKKCAKKNKLRQMCSHVVPSVFGGKCPHGKQRVHCLVGG